MSCFMAGLAKRHKIFGIVVPGQLSLAGYFASVVLPVMYYQFLLIPAVSAFVPVSSKNFFPLAEPERMFQKSEIVVCFLIIHFL